MRSSDLRAPRVLAACMAMFAMLAWASAHGADPTTASPSTAARATQLRAMTPEAQVQFGQRVADWNALPRAERESRRDRYQAWRQLDESERVRLRGVAAQLQAYPPERLAALRAQFDSLDDVQRHGWRLGPVLGADYVAVQPLLAYVPAAQRAALLQRLRGMDSAQRADLGVLAQRTPPQDRAGLRSQLLAVPPSSTTRWLQDKLAK